MTTAEMLRAEGEVRGRAEALVQLLTLKFGPVSQAALDSVHAASSLCPRTKGGDQVMQLVGGCLTDQLGPD